MASAPSRAMRRDGNGASDELIEELIMGADGAGGRDLPGHSR